MIGTKKLMELFDDPHRTSLRVHEATAEVAIEIGGVSIPVTGARWKSRQLAGRRQYTLIIQGDADELAYLTQQEGPDRHGAGLGASGRAPGRL